MIIYSKKIVAFLIEIKAILKQVLNSEINLRVNGDRFYNQSQTVSFPIKVVIYNNKNMLGYFDPNFLEIGLHEKTMYFKKEQFWDLIRHELGHYITFIEHNYAIKPHGIEFKTFCRKMGWNENVAKATMCLETESDDSISLEESAIFKKIQKLMALGSSSNQNEAELAMIKAQQLLLKHNLESKYFEDDKEEKIYLKRILKQKKENAKMRSIARILETFFVSVVYNRAGEHIYLEILGTAVNIEIAEYVADYLHHEIENLWESVKQSLGLKGMLAKNSFFMGLAKGYCNKIQVLKRDYSQEISRSLMIIEKKLIDAQNMAYQRLSTSRSKAGHCPNSAAAGEQMGKLLQINPAIGKTSNPSQNLSLNFLN